jgi:hypothetical protein
VFRQQGFDAAAEIGEVTAARADGVKLVLR